MKELFQSHSFVTNILGLLGVIGTGVAVPNSPFLSIAVALITGATQAARAYTKVRTQPTVSLPDTSIRLSPPSL